MAQMYNSPVLGSPVLGNSIGNTLGNTIQTGISQPPDMTPKKVISMFGQEYILCKDAADSTTAFPHGRVKIQNGDCVPINEGNIQVYFCYIHGIIQPLPNSLEKPVDVYYVGFHKNYVDMRFITPADVSRMHIYKCDTVEWASTFAKHLLGVTPESDHERDPISPWPQELLQKQTNENLDKEFRTNQDTGNSQKRRQINKNGDTEKELLDNNASSF